MTAQAKEALGSVVCLVNAIGLNIGWMDGDQEKALHAAQWDRPEWFAERAAQLPFGRLIQT